MRRWNLSVHIDRLHKGNFNPLYNPTKISFHDAKKVLRNNSNSFLPDFESTGPIEPTIELFNLLQQIKTLSRFELIILLRAIHDRL